MLIREKIQSVILSSSAVILSDLTSEA